MKIAVDELPIGTLNDKMVSIAVRGDNISFAYKLRGGQDDVQALREFTLEVHDGEFLAILGPSGCGKSTFLRLLAGLERVDSGTLLYQGHATSGPSPERGMLFQAYALFPWKTVRENVEFGPRARRVPRARRMELVDKYLKQVGLFDDVNKYPHELSGGMQQRAALARLYANEPELMLMDEPFAAVDAQTRAILQENLLKLWQSERRTVIFVTHAVDEAVFLADRVAVMTARPGRIKEIVPIPLPRPRDVSARRTSEFHSLVDTLSELVRPEIREE